MAGIDIDPFGEHGRTEWRTDKTGEYSSRSRYPRRKINLRTNT